MIKINIKKFLYNLGFVYKLAWKISIKIFIVNLVNSLLLTNLFTYGSLYFVKRITDYITVGIKEGFYIDTTLLLLCLALLLIKIISQSYNGYFQSISAEFQAKAAEEMQNIVIKKAAKIKMEYYETPDFYNRYTIIVNRASSNVFGVLDNANNMLSSIISIMTSAAILLGYNLWIPVIIGLLSIFSAIWSIKDNKNTYKYIVINTPITRKLQVLGSFFGTRKSIQEVKLNNSAEYILNKREELVSELIKNGKKEGIWKIIWGNLNTFFFNVGNYTAYYFCAVYALIKKISLGDFSLALGASGNLINGISRFTSGIGILYMCALQFEEFICFQNCEEDTNDLSDGNIDALLPISVENLSFSYPGNSMLSVKDISFQINKGEKICIVGYNGAGKSTLIKLLMGIYSDYRGSIRYNGNDARYINKDIIFKNFTVAMQDYCKYPFSIKDNIIISDYENDTGGAYLHAAKAAEADRFVHNKPHGYNTMLNKEFEYGGTELSEGEWHKIVLSRALFRKRDILVFDEPTASLDPLAEKHIFSTIFNEYKDKTIIVVSHRLSCCMDADKIIVLQNGEMVECGNHETLLKKDGVYKELFEIQARGYSKEGDEKK